MAHSCGTTRDRVPYTTPECLTPVHRTAARRQGDLVVETFAIDFDGVTYPHARLCYIVGRGPAPVILVHHNYAGLKQFDVDTASFYACAGYVGLAVDLFPESPRYSYADRSVNSGPLVSPEAFRAQVRQYAPATSDVEIDAVFAFYAEDDPTTGAKVIDWQYAKHRTGGFTLMNKLYLHPARWRGLLAKHLERAFAHPAVAAGEAGAIGYCLGGQSCLEQLRSNQPLRAVSLVHGVLHSRPLTVEHPYDACVKLTEAQYRVTGVPGYWDAKDAPLNTYTTGCVVLVENGSLDPHASTANIAEFEAEMNANGIDYRFETQGGADHGFALAPGVCGNLYHEKADRRSTLATLALFAETWPHVQQHPVPYNAAGTRLALADEAGRRRSWMEALRRFFRFDKPTSVLSVVFDECAAPRGMKMKGSGGGLSAAVATATTRP